MSKLPDNATLLVIDVQQAFDQLDYWGGASNNPDAEANMLRLMAAWRKSERPIVHVQHNSITPGSPLAPDQAGNAFQKGFEPQPGEGHITKNVNSAFIGTDLEQQLRDNNVTHVVIVGLTTNHCVSTTTRMAGNLGFDTYLPADATAAHPRTGHNGTHYSARQMHDTALASLHGEFATVTSVDDIIAML